MLQDNFQGVNIQVSIAGRNVKKWGFSQFLCWSYITSSHQTCWVETFSSALKQEMEDGF